MILIVTYDLKSPRDHTTLYEALKSQGTWWHYIASTWLLSTIKSPEQVALDLHAHMDPQDLLFVAELSARYTGYLPQQAWDWINEQRKLEEEKLEKAKLLMRAVKGALTGAPKPPPEAPTTMPRMPPVSFLRPPGADKK